MLGQNYFTCKTIGWGTMALFHWHDLKEQPASAVILAVDDAFCHLWPEEPYATRRAETLPQAAK